MTITTYGNKPKIDCNTTKFQYFFDAVFSEQAILQENNCFSCFSSRSIWKTKGNPEWATTVSKNLGSFCKVIPYGLETYIWHITCGYLIFTGYSVSRCVSFSLVLYFPALLSHCMWHCPFWILIFSYNKCEQSGWQHVICNSSCKTRLLNIHRHAFTASSHIYLSLVEFTQLFHCDGYRNKRYPVFWIQEVPTALWSSAVF
jgi:hypothetical protein